MQAQFSFDCNRCRCNFAVVTLITRDIASASITIKAELRPHELIQRAVKWVFARAKPENSSSAAGYRGAASATSYQRAASATGDHGAASATGDQSAASAAGGGGAASAAGYRGAASATGDHGAASATGYQGAASAAGNASVAMSCGCEGRVSGADGCALFLVNRDPETGEIRHVWAGIVGRNSIKPNTFYTLNDNRDPKEVTP